MDLEEIDKEHVEKLTERNSKRCHAITGKAGN